MAAQVYFVNVSFRADQIELEAIEQPGGQGAAPSPKQKLRTLSLMSADRSDTHVPAMPWHDGLKYALATDDGLHHRLVDISPPKSAAYLRAAICFDFRLPKNGEGYTIYLTHPWQKEHHDALSDSQLIALHTGDVPRRPMLFIRQAGIMDNGLSGFEGLELKQLAQHRWVFVTMEAWSSRQEFRLIDITNVNSAEQLKAAITRNLTTPSIYTLALSALGPELMLFETGKHTSTSGEALMNAMMQKSGSHEAQLLVATMTARERAGTVVARYGDRHITLAPSLAPLVHRRILDVEGSRSDQSDQRYRFVDLLKTWIRKSRSGHI
ncbi:hypothetical protein LTR36_006917 [Oleoguttula mirabilis]|uniref:Uncharacterized protein n=1 Tax=Oleoguttula mirabilis TaxID=1507867 RepID=A0AAV9JBF9_9PEZI|nr:hypothetical protein LTR36_006917 [Oleoguttula mirabilis]